MIMWVKKMLMNKVLMRVMMKRQPTVMKTEVSCFFCVFFVLLDVFLLWVMP